MADKETKLKHPFDFEEKKIEAVTFKERLKANDLLASEAEMQARNIVNPGQATHTFYLVSRATGLEPEALEEMDLADYLGLAEKANGFL